MAVLCVLLRAYRGFVLRREIAQYIHEISGEEEVRKLYLQHNGAAAEYLDSTYDGSGAESEDGAYEGDTEHELKKPKPTKIWKAWMATSMTDLKSSSLTTQVQTL